MTSGCSLSNDIDVDVGVDVDVIGNGKRKWNFTALRRLLGSHPIPQIL